MASLQDLRGVPARGFGNMLLAAPTLAVATTTTKIKTTTTVAYLFDGKFKSLAATDNITVVAPTSSQLPNEYDKWRLYNLTTTAPAAGCTFYVVVAVDSAGTVTCFQGTYAGQDLTFRGAAMAKGDGLIPQIPDGFVPVGIIKFVFSAASTFTWGTTALATAGNLTISFADYAVLPSTTTI